MTIERIEWLQSMPIFGAVDTAVLTYLLQSSRFRQIKQGDYFFREGDLADSMFVLDQGIVAVYRNWQGRDFKLRDLHPGDCFGEMALLDCQPRSASVIAQEDATAMEIDSAQLAEIYEQFPDQFVLIHMNMAREICRRLCAADQRLFEISMGNEQSALV
ncbi:MAG: cyclic nucleotide-binding domain-containing protein [Gammaproteobacteria bacterium]|jgi:CRP-like cAMP-binding protein|nr:cyclic nucleotide-binding domain-containing protein [Gammaproteobacteria bacterium]